ncbi:pseudaminic acid biosynthesis-associated methylase [Chitinibacter sp. S2-10]|uniref:pseudaminic acid biosynthesis-associated methylase n=1 Tax=Chitinibacter sp. S2-10 TaxID=3373597 RepID=UPI00397749F6
MRPLTEQEQFWQGEFGDEYVSRNQGDDWVASNIAFFSEVLRSCSNVSSILELGTNRGLNLHALHTLLPDADLHGVELNSQACDIANQLGYAQVWQGSLFDYPITHQTDLSFTKGVLIHLAPELLEKAYAQLYRASRRYILIAEYYNPSPVEVRYRGNDGKLFKRDFAGEMLDLYPDLKLKKYGFIYRRDPVFPQDDICWFLMEKHAG